MWVELPRPVTGYVTFYNSTALFIDWKRINTFQSRIHLFTVLYSNKGKYSERHFLYFLYSLVDLLLQTGPDVEVLPDDGCPGTWLSTYMTLPTLPIYIYLQRLHFIKSEWLQIRDQTQENR